MSEQLAATIFPDSTRSAGAAADGSFGSAVLVGFERADELEFLADVLGKRGGVGDQAVGLRGGRRVIRRGRGAGQDEFSSRRIGGAAVPVAVEVVDPAVPVGVAEVTSLVAGGAAFRQPVTVIFLSELDGAACGAAGVFGACGSCAKTPTAATLTIAAHTPVQTFALIIPPMRAETATLRPRQLSPCESRHSVMAVRLY